MVGVVCYIRSVKKYKQYHIIFFLNLMGRRENFRAAPIEPDGGDTPPASLQIFCSCSIIKGVKIVRGGQL